MFSKNNLKYILFYLKTNLLIQTNDITLYYFMTEILIKT